LGTVIGSLPPPTSNTLCHLFQLQQLEIVLQNALHSQKGEITTWLREHMRMRISNFGASHQKTPDQHLNELTRQLIDAQLVSIKSLEPGPLQTGLFIALTQVLRKLNSGRLIIPICVMDSIEHG
jgi:hypothetical protein